MNAFRLLFSSSASKVSHSLSIFILFQHLRLINFYLLICSPTHNPMKLLGPLKPHFTRARRALGFTWAIFWEDQHSEKSWTFSGWQSWKPVSQNPAGHIANLLSGLLPLMACSVNSFFFFFPYLFLAMLGLCCGTSFSLVVASKGCSLVAVCGLLIAVAPPVAQHRL